jgi:hypothetical protein
MEETFGSNWAKESADKTSPYCTLGKRQFAGLIFYLHFELIFVSYLYLCSLVG